MNDTEETPEAKQQPARRSSKRFLALVEVLLVFASLVGLCFAVAEQSEAYGVRQKRKSLEKKVGVLRITDPTKYYVVLIDDLRENEFRWRVYIPECDDFQAKLTKSERGNSSSLHGNERALRATNAVVILTLVPSEDGEHVGFHFRIIYHDAHYAQQSAGAIRCNDPEIVRCVRMGDRTNWQVTGQDGPEQFELEKFIWLLKVKGATQPESSGSAKRSIVEFGVGSKSLAMDDNP